VFNLAGVDGSEKATLSAPFRETDTKTSAGPTPLPCKERLRRHYSVATPFPETLPERHRRGRAGTFTGC